MSEENEQSVVPVQKLPKGAQAFQRAVDESITPDIWKEILSAQVKKAKEGNEKAARFLIEYAGGVASFRGATFVQQTHHHQHYHGETGPSLTDRQEVARPAKPQKRLQGDDVPDRTPDEYESARERAARQVASRVKGGTL